MQQLLRWHCVVTSVLMIIIVAWHCTCCGDLHPGVVGAMDADIRLMRYVASWVDYLYPDVHWIALKECVDEFSFVMQQQVSSWLVDHEEVYN